ncbi:CHAT domain-containing protein [Spirulina sp. 06S082]|uniref:CHAT domain-containing protein n=1 Tax=Spirulina sp. 06S082 TaxID=3110248 RepID=UPI002B1F0991|nr:CHAT domain-containing protein [Spirulina sp. 06S082]MEA5470387.1 CHAT domain-containing protein [Spirulina sp. 06S082]
MNKLVILDLGQGNLNQEIPVSLEIKDENYSTLARSIGKLPAALDLVNSYKLWQNNYRSLSGNRFLYLLNNRARVGGTTSIESIKTIIKKITEDEEKLTQKLNKWLKYSLFYPVYYKLLEQLVKSDTVRIVIQTDNHQLRQLPWHCWDFWDGFTKVEIALSLSAYEKIQKEIVLKSKIRILAILGNSNGINIKKDREFLEKLPDTEIAFLVEPDRPKLTEYLWDEEGWNIIFFAGHSSSNPQGDRGKIYLNRKDSYNLKAFRFALKKAIERGTHLAIFNSCDGLGLARELADLQIPQIIVMREPVPDIIAQEFLKHFLSAYSKGKPLYLAVREARERLQGWEDTCPCAMWLPVLCQHPSETTLNWQDFLPKKVSRKNNIFLNLIENIAAEYGYLEYLPPKEGDLLLQTLNTASEEELTPAEKEIFIVTVSYCSYFKRGFPVPFARYRFNSDESYYKRAMSEIQLGKLASTYPALSSIVKDSTLSQILSLTEVQ